MIEAGPDEALSVEECAVFMLIQDGRILVERRSATAATGAGLVDIPGGHLEAGETPEQALHRELLEELGLEAAGASFICTLLHVGANLVRLHYFAIHQWTGQMQNNEADSLLWLSLTDVAQLDYEVDRIAVSEYLRVSEGLPQ